MKHLYFTIVLLTSVTVICGQGRGMNAISTAGGSIETKGLVVSWTIGEDLIDFAGINTTTRQIPGYNPSVCEMQDGTLLKVYPTLTRGRITVEIRSSEKPDLQLELLDLKGSILRVINVDSDNCTMDLSGYVQGAYLLRISNHQKTDKVNVRISKVY